MCINCTAALLSSACCAGATRTSCGPAGQGPRDLARGHLLDFCYAVFYALLVIPLIVLLGAGFSGLLAHAAPYLVLPRVPGAPGWCFVALTVIGIDASTG